MSQAKRALAGKSNEMLEALRELKITEARKRHEPISTPMFHKLADDVYAQSRRIFRIAIQEEDLGNQSKRGAETIDDIAGDGRPSD